MNNIEKITNLIREEIDAIQNDLKSWSIFSRDREIKRGNKDKLIGSFNLLSDGVMPKRYSYWATIDDKNVYSCPVCGVEVKKHNYYCQHNQCGIKLDWGLV